MLTVGLTREATTTALSEDSAQRVSPLVPDVFASTRMIGLIERTCTELMAEHLSPGQTSVGTGFCLSHEAPTPIGMRVTVTVSLAEIDRRRCVFDVEARDEVERIGVGRHERFVIDRASFLERIAAKAGRPAT